MAKLHINIGSNQDRRKNISLALDALKLNFFEIVCSNVFQSPAEGFDGDDFYNVGVNATTNLAVSDVVQILHNIEDRQGRDRMQTKFSSRQIDLDLVLYDNVIDAKYNLPRDDILKYSFVLAPLTQLNPQGIHPIEGKNYTQLNATMATLKSYNIEILNEK